MATYPNARYYTLNEYLALERQSAIKHEFVGGRIFAMAGGSPAHNTICANIIMHLGPQLTQRGCYVYTSDQRIMAGDHSYYPDFSAACETPLFDAERPQALLNPTLLVEVFSESTERVDREEKRQAYQNLSSLTDYLLVWQSRPCIEHYAQQPDGTWRKTIVEGADEQLELPNLEAVIQLHSVFARVDFELQEDVQ